MWNGGGDGGCIKERERRGEGVEERQQRRGRCAPLRGELGLGAAAIELDAHEVSEQPLSLDLVELGLVVGDLPRGVERH